MDLVVLLVLLPVRAVCLPFQLLAEWLDNTALYYIKERRRARK